MIAFKIYWIKMTGNALYGLYAKLTSCPSSEQPIQNFQNIEPHCNGYSAYIYMPKIASRQ